MEVGTVEAHWHSRGAASETAVAARLWSLARWRWLMGARELARAAFHTLQGRIVLGIFALTVPSLWTLFHVEAGVVRAGLDRASISGILIVSHISLTACFAVMLVAYLLKMLVEREGEALLAHPWVLPELAVLRVAEGITLTSGYLLGFFWLFQVRLFTGVQGRWWIVLGHVVAANAYFWLLGVLVAAVMRWTLLGSRIIARAVLLQRLTIVPFLLTFPLFVALPALFLEHAPHRLATIGEGASTWLFMLQFPVAVVDSIWRGAWTALIAWSVSLAIMAGLAGVALWQWKERALEELPLDLNARTISRHGSGFTSFLASRFPRSRDVRTVWLIWMKDVALPFRRDLTDYLRTQIVPLALLTASFAGATRLETLASHDASLTAVLTTGLALAIALAAMRRSLGALGEEGEGIALLRPILEPREILLAKLGGSIAYSFAHSLLYGAFLLLGARVGGVAAPPPTLLLGGAVTLSLFLVASGTAIGFLLPDFSHDLAGLPGASVGGKALYAVVGGAIVALHVGGRYLVDVGSLPVPVWAGVVALLGTLVLGGSAILTWRGMVRLGRIEP